MAENIHKNCGQCIRFATLKCSQRFSKVPAKKNEKAVHSWGEFLAVLYDFTLEPVEYYKVESIPVLKSDVACVDFVPWRGHR